MAGDGTTNIYNINAATIIGSAVGDNARVENQTIALSQLGA